MLVRIITASPRLAVMPSSRTMAILMCRITRKPSTSVTSATDPGTSSRASAVRAAGSGAAPRTATSWRQALPICTAWLTPMEKIRNGTRMDMGSMP